MKQVHHNYFESGIRSLDRKPNTPPNNELMCQFEVMGQAPELHPIKRQYKNPARMPAMVNAIFGQLFSILFFIESHLTLHQWLSRKFP